MDADERDYLMTLDKEELVDQINELLQEQQAAIRLPPELSEYNQYSRTEIAHRLSICERVRRHWRLLALGACLGKYTLDDITSTCFRESLGIVPKMAHLEEELSKMVEEAEQRMEQQFGPRELRSIVLRSDES